MISSSISGSDTVVVLLIWSDRQVPGNVLFADRSGSRHLQGAGDFDGIVGSADVQRCCLP